MAVMWKDEYSVGVPDIDKQHKKLFDSISNLEKLVNDDIFEGPEIERLLKFLGAYVQTHFTFEENCMRQHKCPVAAKNKAAHDKFLQYYTEFNTEFAKSLDKK